ncbi:LOW QUALITY PROTEIN: uncharacterized protein LOC135219120 [Macrobrachium nipponense]|uniref:LOW QUALITY PROTEIN: uncharacterized protein LOC135219120 n=1 Tax=Macrobrachium nipponense TaxID=159736 RepID=UPI0030C7E815
MLEVLVLGLVGLTYTCVQTLFFLNCLNSRRREQRRLEKAYRESLRKLKNGGDVALTKNGPFQESAERDRKENGIDFVVVDVENGSERGRGPGRSPREEVEEEEEGEGEEEDEGQDQLVTRLVVTSGEEVLLPTSQSAAEGGTPLRSVLVHKAVVELSDPSAENGPGTPPVVSREAPGYSITVNSNMIEISGGGGSGNDPKEPIYEMIEGGEPSSILTEMTVCEDQEALADNQGPDRKPVESVSADVLGGLQPRETQSLVNRHSSSTTTADVADEEPGFLDVPDSQLDVSGVCSIEDGLESLYENAYELTTREDINLVNTISQILRSPPESMEPGSEHLDVESPETRTGGSELRAKTDNLTLSTRSHLANRSTIERGGNDRLTSAGVEGPPLSQHSPRESCSEVTRYGESRQSFTRPFHNERVPVVRPPKGKGSTWTLPRATSKRIPDGHYASLSRTKAKPSTTNGEATGNKRNQEEHGSLLSGQTLPRPRGGHRAKRDEAVLGGVRSSTLFNNTCHSTRDMAEAATSATLPVDTIADSTKTTNTANATFITCGGDGGGDSISCGDMAEYSSSPLKESGTLSLKKKKKKLQRGDHSDLRLPDNALIPTGIPSDDHTDSEESAADSLYYTASDHTNSDAYSEIRGDSEESFEGLLYEEAPEEPRDACGVVTDSSDRNGKMSVNRSGQQMDRSQNLTPHPFDDETKAADELNNNKDASGKNNRNSYATKSAETTEDSESIESESHYESVRDFDHLRDSGYESPVKADVHSSDDAASTISTSSVENHYEDIDPSRMGQGRGRQSSSSKRGRPLKESHSKDSSPKKEEPEDEYDEDDEESVEARQRQRLQELDDLIAGVPPPDYDSRRPLPNGITTTTTTTTTDSRAATGRPGNIPPPPEFGDTSSGSGDSITVHRAVHSTHSVPPNSSSPSSSPVVSGSQQRSPLLRTVSEPNPPPPPPLPAHTPSPRSSPAVMHRISPQLRESSSPRLSSHESSQRSSFDSGGGHSDGLDEESVVRPSEFIRRNSQRGENGSFRGHKKVDRPVSLPLDVAEHYGKIMTSTRDKAPTTTQDDSSSATLPAKPHLSNGKSLPFIPPKFPSQPSGSGLIKPSEYLRSLGGTTTGGRLPMGTDVKSLVAMHSSEGLSASFDSQDHHHSSHSDSQPASMPVGPLPSIPEATEEESSRNNAGAPPPPPAPPAPATSASPAPPTSSSSSSSANTLNRSNTLNSNSSSKNKSKLPTISVTDLQSVQLRKTENKAPKPTSVPIRIPLSPEPALAIAKDDVIAELKMGVDISGIKKLKSERAKEEVKHCKMEKEELEKQFSAMNFVDQIPEKDNAGNRIPEWKRQMLARKAAERARKVAEEQLQQQLEEKRLQAIPPWKRQLLMKRDDDGKRSSLYIPKVEEAKKIHVVNSPQDITRLAQRHEVQDLEEARDSQKNGPSSSNNVSDTSSQERKEEEEEEGAGAEEEEKEEPQMPWRSNLRKTRSKVSLLE